MEREFNRLTLQGVYQMLYEIGKGNFGFQIIRTGFRDELEALIAVFNVNAKRLNRSRQQFLWANRYNEVVVISTLTFLIDENLQILDYKCDGDVFGDIKQQNSLKGKSFGNLLTPSSNLEFRKNIRNLLSTGENFINLQLAYEFYKVLELKLDTVVAKVTHDGHSRFTIHSSLLDSQKDKFFNLKENESINKISIWDQQLFLNIEEYILDHINEPSKKNYELARMFNTNEHKIKTGFKKVVGLTPKQYHKKHRIIQCKILVENTEYSLHQIAIKMGFKSYPKFSRYFKKEVKMTPKSYRERSKTHNV
ncbi:helix-turn-helix domain-containing protein [Zunongwangia sp. HRR-M8]|uniref:helix-turn-helix domain-containing protein n=1 Tax=Zunongwangia sp. HRR-M8 TaxID=3015170 RepID=UPI0022DDC483|nr:AraC family transcriptional regulator [Zunongwangia sp. HRR-M8]WBL22328.1 AraC family transcriptional regulator [Zunongwangia sp. HRR-M8]